MLGDITVRPCDMVFALLKRTGKYFAKKWPEQKVVGIEVVGLYITYQKYKRIDGPSSYQFRENWT